MKPIRPLDVLREIREGYAWLWRAVRDTEGSYALGCARFVWICLGDALALAGWWLAGPVRHGVLRREFALPAMVLLAATTVLIPSAPHASRSRGPDRAPVASNRVNTACGGGIVLGAVAVPGDELVSFAACSSALIDADPTLFGAPGAGEVEPHPVLLRAGVPTLFD
jgi:hypothetical protein